MAHTPIVQVAADTLAVLAQNADDDEPQVARGAAHVVPQAPPEHTRPAAQAVPQAPQCEVATRVSVSQPLLALPSQSPNPVAQAATVHTPAAQAPVALGGAQPRAQAPQWVALVRVSASQPLLGSPSQSAKPVVQV